ncbi:MAG TPA: hypothetical protein VGJ34_04035 [Gaiellaceae bacterium]
MWRISVIAATLFLLACTSACSGSSSALGHSCGASDRRFIQAAAIDVTALGSLTADYQSGNAAPEEVAQEAFEAAERVTHVKPNDPSLRTAQRYLDAMFHEYGEAVTLQGEGKDAAERMYRAYGLANFAHDVLAQAQPELLERGCDVGPLL